jgi:hypothetical protein
VDQRRRTSSAVIIAAITTVLLPGPVLAADAAEVESLRREVRQLQADLQMLRTAVAEATELERLRSTNLAKQMREPQKAAEAAQPAPPPIASAEAPGASRETNAVVSPTAGEERPARAKHRRNRHTSRGRAKAGKVQAR